MQRGSSVRVGYVHIRAQHDEKLGNWERIDATVETSVQSRVSAGNGIHMNRRRIAMAEQQALNLREVASFR